MTQIKLPFFSIKIYCAVIGKFGIIGNTLVRDEKGLHIKQVCGTLNEIVATSMLLSTDELYVSGCWLFRRDAIGETPMASIIITGSTLEDQILELQELAGI